MLHHMPKEMGVFGQNVAMAFEQHTSAEQN